MYIRKIIKWCVPHGIYEIYRKNRYINNPPISNENRSLTKIIGNDWKISPYYEFAEKYLHVW